MSTSDAFLRRFASQSDEVVYAAPYREVWQTGTPAQRAVLDALSDRLGLAGEARALTVFDRLTFGDPSTRPALLKSQNEGKERLNTVREPALGPLFVRWPALRWGRYDADDYHRAFDGAMLELTKDDGLRRALNEAENAHEQADEAVDDEEAALMRFSAVYEHIVEAQNLREHGKAETKAQFERVWKAEQRVLPLAAPR